MKSSVLARFALSVAAALLADCGGSQPPIVTQGAIPQRVSAATHSGLIYALATPATAVNFFTFGQGRLVGIISGIYLSQGMCADPKGDVWISDTGAQKIVEYAHGETKRIATQSDSGEIAADCSVDPTTGNLAVANVDSGGPPRKGNLVIYGRARSSPRVFRCLNIQRYGWVSYDSKGDLFVDGLSARNKFGFCALYKGSRWLRDVTLDHSIGSPGPVRWDGSYVGVGDQGIASIYRFKVAGNNGRLIDTVHLRGTTVDITDFVFVFANGRATQVLVNTYRGSALGFWNYPAGGSPIRTLGSIYGSNFFALSE